MGVLKIPEQHIVTKWRLQPGKMLLVDLEQGRLIPDDEIKAELAKSHPYSEWLDRTQIVLEELPDAPTKGMRSNLSLIHISEPTRLGMISYAVFCLKKKKKKK